MTISLAKAKTLCNASELALVSASTRQQIGELSAAQLRQKVTRTRTLRDKWRDQAERQRRAVQERQAARQTSASARSAEKAQLFGEVLERFEKRLAKVSDEGTSGGGTVRKTPPRKVRAKQHRATRAGLRESLDQTRREMDAAAKKRLKPKPAEQAAEQPESEPAAPPAPEPPSKKRKQGRVQPAASRTTTGLAAAQGLRVTKGQQRRAQTVAKKNRLKAGGNIRIQKHLSAQTKRRQARRDSR